MASIKFLGGLRLSKVAPLDIKRFFILWVVRIDPAVLVVVLVVRLELHEVLFPWDPQDLILTEFVIEFTVLAFHACVVWIELIQVVVQAIGHLSRLPVPRTTIENKYELLDRVQHLHVPYKALAIISDVAFLVTDFLNGHVLVRLLHHFQIQI